MMGGSGGQEGKIIEGEETPGDGRAGGQDGRGRRSY